MLPKTRRARAGTLLTALLLALVVITPTQAMAGTETPAPSPSGRTARSILLGSWCAARNAGAGNVVVLGDSTSTGYGTTGYTGGDGDPWQPTYSGWASALSRSFTGSTWTMLSRNGALTRDYLPGGRWPSTANFPDTITAKHPQLVIIMLGGNDYGIDVPVTTYQSNLTQITAKIRAKAPIASLVYVSMWSFDYRWANHTPVHTYPEYVTAARTVATQTGALHVDLTQDMPATTDHPEIGLYTADEYGPNAAVHATDAGNWVARGVLRTQLSC